MVNVEDYDDLIMELIKMEDATFRKIASYMRECENLEDAFDNGIFDEEWFENLIIEMADRIQVRRKLREYVDIG